jgi:hypothetical protein
MRINQRRNTMANTIKRRLLDDPQVGRAISNILARSEKQPDIDVLERTYVDSGVLPQLHNANAQILYGRRGTGKSHVFRVLGAAIGLGLTQPAVDRHQGSPDRHPAALDVEVTPSQAQGLAPSATGHRQETPQGVEALLGHTV